MGRGSREAATGPDGNRAEVIALCRHVLPTPLRPLTCRCRRDGEAQTAENACHADVLLDLLGRHTDGEWRALGDG